MDEQGKIQGKFLAQNCPGVVVGEEDTKFDTSAKALKCARFFCYEGKHRGEGEAAKNEPYLTPTQLGLIVACCILLDVGIFAYAFHLQTRIGAIHDLASRAHTQHAVESQQVNSLKNQVLWSSIKNKAKSNSLLGRTKRQHSNQCATHEDISNLQRSIRYSTHPSAHVSFPAPGSRQRSDLLTSSLYDSTYIWANKRENFSLHSFYRLTNNNIDIPQAGYYYIYGQVTIQRKNGSSSTSADTCCYAVFAESVHLFSIVVILPPNTPDHTRQESVYSGGTFHLPDNTRLVLKPEGATVNSCVVYTTPDKTFFGAFKL